MSIRRGTSLSSLHEDHLDLHRRKSPMVGGFWERLVKSIKRPLKKVIGRTSLTYDQLQTLIVEIEGLLNARPLTYISFESFPPGLRTPCCQLAQWSIFRSYKHKQMVNSKASTPSKVTRELCKAVENRVPTIVERKFAR